MFRIASGLLMFLVAAAALPAAPEPGEAALPATALDRESNNPAKAAIKARQAQAQDKEKAEQKAAAEEASAAGPGPLASNEQLVQAVEAALGNDIRTAKLGVSVKLDEGKLIGLHGSVPSIESRTAVVAVATKVAGAPLIKSYLVVRKQNR